MTRSQTPVSLHSLAGKRWTVEKWKLRFLIFYRRSFTSRVTADSTVHRTCVRLLFNTSPANGKIRAKAGGQQKVEIQSQSVVCKRGGIALAAAKA